ncbi:MAG: Ig-like domain-containing protein, partial [Acidobacteria bacterium]|nr:Ig-like domain-containing protein [Acidobacteriota bacterium]
MTHARRRFLILAATLFVALGAGAGASRAPLAILSAGPTGEVASLGDAAEIRVEFSEPMVPLGRTPAAVTVPFFAIAPAVKGTFRWAGTTTLIFTPAAPLPFATRYTVRITAAATAASGNTLSAPYTFTFTTPTVRLLGAGWYREGGRVDGQIVVGLQFNQPVSAAGAAPHIGLAYAPHEWQAPAYPPAALARLKAVAADAVAAFERKTAATLEVAGRDGPIAFAPAAKWDTDRFPASDHLVILRSTSAPPPESWVAVNVAPAIRGLAGRATPGEAQSYTLQLEPAFFVEGFACHSQCDPSDWNPIRFRVPTRVAPVAKALSVADITSATAPVKPASAPAERDEADATPAVTLEDAGFAAQPAARRYAVTLAPSLQSADGQTLGYAWMGVVENWHAGAFTSFGDGHG